MVEKCFRLGAPENKGDDLESMLSLATEQAGHKAQTLVFSGEKELEHSSNIRGSYPESFLGNQPDQKKKKKKTNNNKKKISTSHNNKIKPNKNYH